MMVKTFNFGIVTFIYFVFADTMGFPAWAVTLFVTPLYSVYQYLIYGKVVYNHEK